MIKKQVEMNLSSFNTKTIVFQDPKSEKFHSLELIKVEGGTFEMGSNEEHDFEKPVHSVSVPTFYIGKYPVTQSFYEFVMGENPSHVKGVKYPVESVSWYKCQEFIEKLNKDFGDFGFGLPSEAQWEYAARGGIHWQEKYKYAGSNEVNAVAWSWENSPKGMKSVGGKKPNQLGIHDMSGNVWEWCEDDWHEDYENIPADWDDDEYEEAPDDWNENYKKALEVWKENPDNAPDNGQAWINQPRGKFRVYRGGSWYNSAYGSSVSYRSKFEPINHLTTIGFRLVLNHY
ncbi:MAG: formylglycine-generating enzyme family protein [Chitinophagales bacterium]